MSADAAPKPAAAKKVAKKPAKPSVHPPVADMVTAAITALNDKKGSSLSAIKKYIQANYKGIDMDRLAIFIRRFLKKAVDDKTVVQTKGTYKMGAKADKPKEAKKPAAEKPKKVKTPKKAAAKKSPKKASKKPTAKKSAKKTPKKAAKKPAAKKPAAKKPAAKKPAAKKPAAKKPAAKKWAIIHNTASWLSNGPIQDHHMYKRLLVLVFIYLLIPIWIVVYLLMTIIK